VAVAACSSSSSGSSGAGGSGSSGGSAPATITLGQVTDLSGPASAYGIPENRGAEIAVDQINAAGGIASLSGAKLALKTFDTASNPDDGQTQASAAVAANVSAVLGGEISDTVLAGINVTQRAGVAWVDVGGTANEINARGYSTVFQAVHDSTQFDAEWLSVAQLAARQLGIAKPTVAIAYSQSSYGTDLLNAFSEANKTAGLKVVTSFGYPLTTTDFSSIAARLATANANIILDMGYPGDGIALAGLFAKQSKPKAKIIIAAGSDAQDVVSQLKSDANGVLVLGDVTPGMKSLPPAFTSFFNAFQAKYHTTPNTQALSGYVAVQLIAAALQKAKSSSPADVVTALRSVSLTQATGDIYPTPASLSFAANGTLNEAPFFAAQVVGGVAKIVYPTALADTTITPYGG
jgi:branched-chain amino acid transport system substrate-binding protein